MSDIVERLRAYAKDQGGWHNIDDTCDEAAAEIERLRTALTTARNDALGEAAKVARGKSGGHNCEYRGIQDWETGEVPCHLTKDGEICECAIKSNLCDEVVSAIRALKGGDA